MFNARNENTCHYPEITKEFLESVLCCQLENYTVSSGVKPGNNFMSALYSISVQIKTELVASQNNVTDTRHYLLKCYPSDPSQQKFLNKANHFYTELCFYTTLAKDLVQFQAESMEMDIPFSLSFPPFHGGQAVNFQDLRNVLDPEAKKIYSPVDNFILMTDMRKAFGYSMTGRAMDIDHVKLAIIELASMHALSWAYMKSKFEEPENLTEKYPFLKRLSNARKTDTWLGILEESTNKAVESIDAVKGPNNFQSAAIQQFCAKGRTVLDYFHSSGKMEELKLRELLKTQTGIAEDTVHWRVVCHGDIWSNNMLFQYNEKTGKPEHVVLVDFPLVKLACPTLDLACLLYTSTRAQLRQMHLEECLQIYHDRFLYICKQMSVDCLANFNMDLLKSKFRTSTLVGLLIAIISFPQDLQMEENDNKEEMDQMNKGGGGKAAAAGGNDLSVMKRTLYQEWIVELVQDVFNGGII